MMKKIWNALRKMLEIKGCYRVVTHPNGMGVLVECKECVDCKKLDKAILESMLLYSAH